MLVDKEGYRYVQNGSSKNSVYWRCIYYKKKYGLCPGKAVTEGFYVKQKSGVHLHKANEPIVHLIHGNSKEAKLLKQKEAENKT